MACTNVKIILQGLLSAIQTLCFVFIICMQTLERDFLAKISSSWCGKKLQALTHRHGREMLNIKKSTMRLSNTFCKFSKASLCAPSLLLCLQLSVLLSSMGLNPKSCRSLVGMYKKIIQQIYVRTMQQIFVWTWRI